MVHFEETMLSDQAVRQHVQSGGLIESESEMNRSILFRRQEGMVEAKGFDSLVLSDALLGEGQRPLQADFNCRRLRRRRRVQIW